MPPKGDLKDGILHLEKVSETLFTEGLDFILGGDFNINLAKSGNGKGKSQMENFANKFSLLQTIKNKTRLDDQGATLIDHIYISNRDNLHESDTIGSALSDHCIVYLCLKKSYFKKTKVNFTCRNMRSYSLDNLRDQLTYMDWAEFYNAPCVEECWNVLYSFYITCLDVIAPFVVMNNQVERERWTTPELLALIRERDAAKLSFNNLMNTYPDVNAYVQEKNTAKKKFNDLRNKVKRLLTKSCKSEN